VHRAELWAARRRSKLFMFSLGTPDERHGKPQATSSSPNSNVRKYRKVKTSWGIGSIT
jgi:hypothetical protein